MSKYFTTRELSEKTHFDMMAEKYDVNYQYNKPFTKYKIEKKRQVSEYLPNSVVDISLHLVWDVFFCNEDNSVIGMQTDVEVA